MTRGFSIRGLVLRPLDLLFFRDGRPMVAGWQANSGLPLPQTLAGAVRTWLLLAAGCDFERLGSSLGRGRPLSEAAAEGQPHVVRHIFEAQIRGPWLARHSADDSWEPLVAAPANLFWHEADGDYVRADPLTKGELPGWLPTEGRRLPLARKGVAPLERVSGYITAPGLTAYLAGGVPDSGQLVPAEDLYGIDRRTGITVGSQTRSVEQGGIYGAGYLALAKHVAFYAEIGYTEETLSDPLQTAASAGVMGFGGDGKKAAVELVPAFPWPQAEPAPHQSLLLLLTTPAPAHAKSGVPWLPEGLVGRVVSAAVPGYRAFSGWDLARRGPKPARFALEAGTVYFLEPGAEPERGDSVCCRDDAALGWGHFLKGVWNHV